MKEKQRIEFIDLAKGICILLVVAMHLIPEFESEYQFLGCLRMPLYFCLSGLFYKNYGSARNFFIKKTNRILIPFLIWYLISYSIYYIGRLIASSGREATYHIADVVFQNDIFNLPLWFLLCLFWSNLFFDLINRISGKWYYQLSLVLMVSAIGWVMSANNIYNFLYVGSCMTCLPFFYLGYALKNTNLLYATKNKKKDFLIMVGCLVAAFIFIFMPEFPPLLKYYTNEIEHGNPVTIYLSASLFVIGVLLICKFIKKIPFVSWIGRYSIIVLVSHILVSGYVSITIELIAKGSLDGLAKELMVFIITVALMLAVIPFCKRFMPYVTAQKDVIQLKPANKSGIHSCN